MPPYTPETLAARWDCSAETVRAMVRRGAGISALRRDSDSRILCGARRS